LVRIDMSEYMEKHSACTRPSPEARPTPNEQTAACLRSRVRRLAKSTARMPPRQRISSAIPTRPSAITEFASAKASCTPVCAGTCVKSRSFCTVTTTSATARRLFTDFSATARRLLPS
jgi:hypothetical protein